ncbi:MAG: DUF1735 domain-containing protein [Chitinophagaceae bacterium]
MKSYIKSILLATATVPVVLMGCLKDKDYDDGVTQSLRSQGNQNVIELKVAALDGTNFTAFVLGNSNSDTTLNYVPVVLDQGPAKTDIKVDVVLNPSLVGSFNAAQGAGWSETPSSLYTILNPPATGGGYVVTIPAGQSTGYIQFKLKPSDFLGFAYALGFQISKIETPGYLISSNFGTAVAAVNIKNIYEGIYHTDGYFQHPSAPRAINQDDFLRTATVTSVYKTLGDLTGTNISITVGSTGVGGVFPVTIAPGPGTSGTTASVAAMAPTGIYNNTYDANTHTFYLHYGYPQPGPSRIITEVVKLK